MTLQQLQSRLDILRSNLEALEKIPRASFEQFAADFRNVQATLHLLQTSVQALVDLGSVLVARLGLPAPRTSHDVLQRLEDAGRLPRGTTGTYAPMIGFRNRVVHLYDRIDERRVFEILTEHRSDLAALFDLLLAVLEALESDGAT